MRMNLMFSVFCFLFFNNLSFAQPADKPLVIAVTQDWDIIHPYTSKMYTSSLVLQFLMKPTIYYDEKMRLTASLAETVPTLENKLARKMANGKFLVQFKIKKNAKWGDGVDLSCEDFEYARQVSADPNTSLIDQEFFTRLDKVEWDLKDPKNCRMIFKKQIFNYNNIGAYLPLSKHVDKRSFEQFSKNTQGYEKNTPYLKDLTNPGLFYGPYLVEEHKMGSHIILKRNPFYFGPPAKSEKVIIKLIPDTNTLETYLRSGEINIVANPGFTLDQALVLDKKFVAEKIPYYFHFEKDIFSEKLTLNMKIPALAEKKVRQALAYSVDADQINQAFFGNKEELAYHFLPSFDFNFTKSEKEIKIYRKDFGAAEKLLTSAGWLLEKDGFRYKNKKRLSLVFSTTSGNRSRETIQTFIANQWKKIGIEVLIKNYPARALFGEIIKCNKQEGIFMAATAFNVGEVPRSNLHSKEIPSEKNNCSGLNNASFSNPAMDNLLEKLDAELNPVKRKALVRQILKIYTEEVPEIPLTFKSKIFVFPTNLAGQIDVGPLGYGFENSETLGWK